MQRLFTSVLLVLFSLWALSLEVFAHGGKYGGPGDTVPPGGSAPGSSSGGPGSPGSSGGPRTGGPFGPNAPGSPGASTGNGNSKGGPGTGQVVSPDLATWTFWWEFNKDPFLNLKAAVHSGGPITGSDDFFVGKDSGKGGRDSQKPSTAQIRGKVVPALLKLLEEETNNDIVTGCLIALGKIGGDPSFVEVIQKHLASTHQEISETAALALGILSSSDPKPKDMLLDLLKDSPKGRKLVDRNEVNFRTRAFAAYGLGLIGHAACQKQIRDEALISDIVQSLRDVYQTEKSSYKDIKVACILSLGLIQDTERKAVEGLRRILDDEKTDEMFRAHVPLTLAKLIGRDHPLREEIVKQFIKIVEDKIEKDFVRQSAVYALGMLVRHGDEIYEKAIKAIEFSVKELNKEQERNFAMIALGKMGGPEAQSFLIQQLTKGRAQSMRPWAALGLGILGRNLVDTDQVPDRIISQKLQDMLIEGGNPTFLGAYAIALGILRDGSSKEILLATMKDVKEDELKGYCCVALGMIGAREAIKDIQAIVYASKQRPDLLQQAAIGLGLLGDKEFVLGLVETLKKSKSLAAQAALASALGFVGASQSIDPLVTSLEDKNLQPLARAFCAAALGLVCDKEKLPWNSKISVDLNYRAAVPSLNDNGTGTGIINIL